ncbi:MAG TPA: oligoendopeptidase F, partial [Clostridia bacterium]|nr:oligoendopeptidase F [Clostridia bacterium]
AKYQAMTDRALQLSVALGAASAFMMPEILSIEEKTLTQWSELPVLSAYKRVLYETARKRPHILSEGEERLLALSAEPLAALDDIFTMLNNADMDFGFIKNEKGEKTELTHGNYRSFIESKHRPTRKAAYQALYKKYLGLSNTLSQTYSASVKSDIFFCRARNYKSSLDAALFSNNVPVTVYTGLIEAVESRLPVLKEYLKLRRDALKLKKLKMYDLYVPIVKTVPPSIEYEDAKALVLEGLAPLGSEYIGLLKKAFNERWIDVYETRGKTSGAYSWGAYGSHPYILLNYQPETDYAFTLAHELGHSLHTHFSDSNLPYQDAQYRIMAAEVASTVNEVLLTKYMLVNAKDSSYKAYIVNHFLEQFRTTVFRQTMFAAFEQKTHAMAEEGTPLTVDSLSGLYSELNKKYYPGVEVDEYISMEWARIPHFYNAFYVYQYATGFSAAVAIAKGILEGRGLSSYLNFLKSGCTEYPIVLLQNAGVDLTQKASILTSLDEFKDAVSLLRELLGF